MDVSAGPPLQAQDQIIGPSRKRSSKLGTFAPHHISDAHDFKDGDAVRELNDLLGQETAKTKLRRLAVCGDHTSKTGSLTAAG